MQHRFNRLAVLAAALAALAASAWPRGRRAAAAADPVVFAVGTTQDFDSLNVTVGALVIDYEAWNLQYATLTDKSADDFSVTPGLAESWEVSDDGLTVTYKLREGLKWSDGQPLTADDVVYTINRSRDEEWINHVSTTANLDAKAHRRPHRRDHDLRPRPEAPGDGRLHRAEAHLREARRGRTGGLRGPRRRRLRPLHRERREEGRVRPHEAQPELVGQEAGDGRGRVQNLRQPGGAVPGAQDRRARRGRRRATEGLRHPQGQRGDRSDRWQPG